LYFSGMGVEAKKKRLMKEHQRLQEESEEQMVRATCTFTPTITAQAKTVYSTLDDDLDVVARLTELHVKKRETELQHVALQVAKDEMEECTFKPQVLKYKPKEERSRQCHARLYEDAMARNQHRQWWAEWWAGIPNPMEDRDRDGFSVII